MTRFSAHGRTDAGRGLFKGMTKKKKAEGNKKGHSAPGSCWSIWQIPDQVRAPRG